MRFQVFDRASHGPIFDNAQIYALATDPAGALWIGTNGGGLVRLADGELRRFGEAEGLPTGRITALAPGTDGELWIGTYGGGLVRMRAGRFEDVLDHRSGLSHPVVFDVAVDHRGAVWVATYGGGLNRWHQGRFEVFDTSNGMASDQVWSVYPGRRGDLWVGTDGGLHRLRDGRFEVFTTADGLPHDRILSVLEDRDGSVWVGTYGGGLGRWIDGSVSRLDRGGGQWTSNNVWTLFEAREGTLWAGTLGGGLNQLEDGPFTTYSVGEGLASEIVSSFHETPGGDLWIATRGGLHRLRDGSFDLLTTADGLAADSLWTVYGDRQENLWVGYSGAGVDRLHRDGLRHFATADGLADDFVVAFLEDRRGDLWIATNGGLNRWRDGELSSYTTADGLAGDQVRALAEGREGLWIGTTRGLSRFDGSSFDNFTTADGLASDSVETLLLDADGTLWIGTRGGGLSRWRAGDVASFTSDDGLLSDDIVSILDDGADHLWLSTVRGIFQVARQDLEAFAEGRLERIGGVAYGRSDGLKSETCYGSQVSSLATRDGRLWFATLDGASVVDPSRLELAPAPAVLVEQLTVDGRVVVHRLPSGGPPPDTESLPPHSRTVELRFTAPTLLAPNKISFRHRLRGFDDTWRPAGESRTASYNNLEPGSYIFEISASDERGRWNGEITAFVFRIRPAFYQTLTFRAMCALALVVLALAIHNARTRHLRRRARELREVDRLKDEILANTSHELRTPLHGITGLAEALLFGVRGELPEPIKNDLSMISASGHRLARLVDDILDFSKLRDNELELGFEPVDLHAVTHAVLTLAEPLAGQKPLELMNSVPKELAATADEARLQQVLYNLIGNAIKFTDSGRVEVSARPDGSWIELSVTDTGLGISPEDQRRIFESFEQADGSVSRKHSGSGLGLAISRRLVELHGGRLQVESKPGAGSRFFLTLPKSEQVPVPKTGEFVTARLRAMTDDAGVVAEPTDDADLPLPDQDFTLMVVDDEPLIRQVLVGHLRTAGYRVLKASGGEEALRRLESETVDLMLLDIMMPGMSGYEMCHRLRLSHAREELPIIFLSARDQVEDMVSGFAKGANDYLIKPTGRHELLARVSTHLSLLMVHRQQAREVHMLQGLLPICCRCKRIRDDHGDWTEIEAYVQDRSEAEFSHGICPTCGEAALESLASES